MTNPPCVSICIPTLNGSTFLAETLDSAEAQDFEDLEIVLSDSGSTDDTLDMIRAFQARSRFPVKVLPPPPPGMVENWNHCIANSAGRYIKFLFQDDLLEPDCLSKMVTLAEADPDVGLVFSPRHLLIDEEARKIEQCKRIESETGNGVHLGWKNLQRLQHGRAMLADPGLVTRGSLNKIGEPTVVLLRAETVQRVGGFNTKLRQLVDLEMWWRVMGHSKVGFIDAPLASFRVHPQQASVGNSRPLQVIAEQKQFAHSALQAEFACEFSTETRQVLEEMEGKNLLFQLLYLQYRKPLIWLRKQLGLGDSQSWKTLFSQRPN
ncbi:Hyaluronan synthase [Novipirellula galeiformis]|uniref:Hyaluronan synthase n=1 Tax=Novipirellula galeiformis TaxID=2528004 RepID=A0A5C6BZ53_9BACT|nr:glycosyltransferase [Novipirellula galeiformis]TWU17112.1 Hyaluronan synthase [Novipirellula galeiformis]